MKNPLTGKFRTKAGEITPEVLEARVAKLPEHFQQKYQKLLEGQDGRLREFASDLEKDREKLMVEITAKELIRLSAPRPVPDKYRRSKKELLGDAKLSAQQKVKDIEQERTERMESILFTERAFFVENAEQRQRDALSPKFREQTRDNPSLKRSFSRQ